MSEEKTEKVKYIYEIELIPQIGKEVCHFLFKKWPELFGEGFGPEWYKDEITSLRDQTKSHLDDFRKEKEDIDKKLENAIQSLADLRTFIYQLREIVEKLERPKWWEVWKRHQ